MKLGFFFGLFLSLSFFFYASDQAATEWPQTMVSSLQSELDREMSSLSLFCFCTTDPQINIDFRDIALSELHIALYPSSPHLLPESLGQGYHTVPGASGPVVKAPHHAILHQFQGRILSENSQYCHLSPFSCLNLFTL